MRRVGVIAVLALFAAASPAASQVASPAPQFIASSPAASPTACFPAAPSQSASPVPTSSATLDSPYPPSPPPCDPATPDDLQARLDAWLTLGPDGHWTSESVPRRKLGVNAGGLVTPLNMTDGYQARDGFKKPQGMELQAVLLGMEVVDGHLVAYLGLEDYGNSDEDLLARTNERFFLGFDLGEIRSRVKVGYNVAIVTSQDGIRYDGPTTLVSPEALARLLAKNAVGQTILAQVWPFPIQARDVPKDQRASAREADRAWRVTRDFVRLGWQLVGWDRRVPLSRATVPASLQPLLNARLTEETFEPGNVPFVDYISPIRFPPAR